MRASLDKDRDMARSILPSKNRRPARAATTHIRRAHRHAVRQELRATSWLADLDEWDNRQDLRRDTSAEIRNAVRWRRQGDKLNHFEAWAIAVTRDLRPEDRLSAMRARLPRGLIGEHAMSHLKRRAELNPASGSHRWREEWGRRRLAKQEADCRERRLLERAVRLMLESPGGHKTLNAAMKAVVQDLDRAPRLLRDVHGVEAFVAGLLASTPWYPPSATEQVRVKELAAVVALADEVDPAWRCRGP